MRREGSDITLRTLLAGVPQRYVDVDRFGADITQIMSISAPAEFKIEGRKISSATTNATCTISVEKI